MDKRKIKAGIVGFGRIGKGEAEDLMHGGEIELVGIAEPENGRRKAAEEEYGVKTYSDYRQLCEQKDIDVIYNATPNFMHAEVATAALKSGKYVFSEKPFAITKKDIAAMLKAEKESGKCLQIDFEMRYSLQTRRIKEIIDAGEIGEPKNILFNHITGGKGFEKKEGDWHSDPAKIGGYYIEEGCHRLDIFRFYMGIEIEEVLAIPAPELRGRGKWHRGYREPASTVCFFPGEKLANLITIQHRAAVPAPAGRENEMGHEYNVSVAGSDGSLRADFWNGYIQIFRFSGAGGTTCLDRTESYKDLPDKVLHHDSTGFFRDFAGRMRDGKPPLMSASDSWKTMACVFACEESFKGGGTRVKVDYNLPLI
ncbi:MAG: Gfo/Idh/MocA family oxidoreductase [Candidatus Omnitrophica bacterium]|nr:Gfo/Idh/MocA family oxidoreductase [Candidatus Omnitrophota bacterium]